MWPSNVNDGFTWPYLRLCLLSAKAGKVCLSVSLQVAHPTYPEFLGNYEYCSIPLDEIHCKSVSQSVKSVHCKATLQHFIKLP